MESFYDKCQPNRNLAPLTEWDFTKWTPQVVAVAIGQSIFRKGTSFSV
ncbi:MAG: hypothetical protein MSA84_05795 [Lachnospiraceae bacterium]|nr:hypothetical protein [Lachnospiraceae bacterium]